ncbi:MAG: hypothetical protein ABSB59_34605 [Streptosporangiaceae bacterium]|jgi:hypothetical protein
MRLRIRCRSSDFVGLEELAGTLLAFVDRYNQTARPFNWNRIELCTDLCKGRPGRRYQVVSLGC